MHFLSQYSSFATQTFDGHLLKKDSPGLSQKNKPFVISRM
jgi:hypothetical protein